jgi:Holliday junction resolvase
MAATPESKVKKKVVEILKSEGAYYFYPVTGGFGRSGVPDIVGCVNGRFFGIECKAGTNKPTALQEAEMARIRHAGGKTLVVNEENTNHVKELVAWIKKQPQET